MKNERTPRTLADSEFTTGYREHPAPDYAEVADYLILVLFALVLAALLWGYL
jgi:hypothetical protein